VTSDTYHPLWITKRPNQQKGLGRKSQLHHLVTVGTGFSAAQHVEKSPCGNAWAATAEDKNLYIGTFFPGENTLIAQIYVDNANRQVKQTV